MIELKNISKAFKEDIHLSEKKIIDGVSIRLNPGRIYGLFGKNGSGKTSILKIIMKLMTPDEGKLEFEESREPHKDISFSSEKMNFFPDFTCKDFFSTIRDIHSIPQDIFENKLSYFLKVFEIEDSLNIKLKYFSQGMLKKTSFIGSLLNNPKFILLDEPFSGLDLDARLILKSEIEKFKNNGGGVLLTSHMFEEVSVLIDDWFYIKQGKIIGTSLKLDYNDISSFDSYHIEIISPNGYINLSQKEKFRHLNKYIYKVPKNKKESFLNEALSKGYFIESIVLNKHKIGDHFVELEGR